MSTLDVIVPCYNYARYLETCIDSVTSQSHRGIRVLIIDDCSPDNTPKIAEALAAADPRVTYRRHGRNEGHIATFNEGIEWAANEYLLVLSADDYLLPGAVERALAALDAHPDAGLLYGLAVSFREGEANPYRAERPWSKAIEPRHVTLAEVAPGTGEVRVVGPAEMISVLGIANHIATPTAICRTSTQKRLGPYRTDLPHAGDFEMWLRLALDGPVLSLDALQAVYRRHLKNMSSGYRGIADAQQVRESLRIHRNAIRETLPDGTAIYSEFRRARSIRAIRDGYRALRRREIRQALSLVALGLSELLLPEPR